MLGEFDRIDQNITRHLPIRMKAADASAISYRLFQVVHEPFSPTLIRILECSVRTFNGYFAAPAIEC